jgi:hypothetical protein
MPAAVVNPGEYWQHGGGEPCGGPLAQAVAVREVNAPKNNLVRKVAGCKITFEFFSPPNKYFHNLQTKAEKVHFLLYSISLSIFVASQITQSISVPPLYQPKIPSLFQLKHKHCYTDNFQNFLRRLDFSWLSCSKNDRAALVYYSILKGEIQNIYEALTSDLHSWASSLSKLAASSSYR